MALSQSCKAACCRTLICSANVALLPRNDDACAVADHPETFQAMSEKTSPLSRLRAVAAAVTFSNRLSHASKDRDQKTQEAAQPYLPPRPKGNIPFARDRWKLAHFAMLQSGCHAADVCAGCSKRR